MTTVSTIDKPIDEITINDIDIDHVHDIAKKELADTADQQWNPYDNPKVTSTIADWYLDLYFNDADELIGGILDAILESDNLDKDADIEDLLGRASANAARSHAVADMDLVADDFASRALTFNIDELFPR